MRFKTNVHLKDVLGRELINDDNIAISELVKNSYDAGATKVKIIFESFFLDNNEFEPRIIIADNGHGMTRKDIEDKWLNIAYSAKKETSTKSKSVAGSKGIGRFSCDRLGQELTLYTKAAVAEPQKLEIIWTDFELKANSNKQIEQINLVGGKVSLEAIEDDVGFSLGKNGTILVIDAVREKWGKAKIKHLKKQLARVVNPNLKYSNKRFDIELIITDLDESGSDLKERLAGIIDSQIWDALQFKTSYIVSWIDEKGKTLTTELYNRGRVIFKIVEENPFIELSSVSLELHYLNPYSKMFFTKTTGYRVTEFGSIFLFINGFRVFPYGDPGDDWLGIDKRKQQGFGRFLGSRETVGRFDILDLNDNFKQVSSREGLVKNSSYYEAFSGFQNSISENGDSFFLKAFKRLERFVVNGLKWDQASSPAGTSRQQVQIYLNMLEKSFNEGKVSSKEMEQKQFWAISESQKMLNIANSINSLIDVPREKIHSIYIDPDVVNEIVEQDILDQEKIIDGLEDYEGLLDTKKVKNVINHLKRDLVTAKNKAKKAETEKDAISKKNESIAKENQRLAKDVQDKKTQLYFFEKTKNKSSHELMYLHHEIGILSGNLSRNMDKLSKYLKKIVGDDTKIESIVARIYQINKQISMVTQYASVADLKKQSSKELRNLPQFIHEYVQSISRNKLMSTSTGGALRIDSSYNDVKWVIEFIPIEICMVLDNLFSNAVKSNATRVSVEFEIDKTTLNVKVANNGESISKGNSKKIFNSAFTTTYGSGMGLSHVESILKEYKGSISLKSLEPVEFLLRFNK